MSRALRARTPHPTLPLKGGGGRYACAAIAIAFLSAPAFADDTPQQQLEQIQQQLQESKQKEEEYSKEADQLAAEIAQARADSIAAAAEAQEHERALSELEAELARLGKKEQEKSALLLQHRAEQQRLLAALALVARNPPEGMALSPGDPVDTFRSATLLGAAVPPLAQRARALHDEIAALADLRRQMTDAETRQHAARVELDKEQTRLAALIARKAVLQQEAQKNAQISIDRQFSLASQAADLQQLIERLDAEKKKEEAEAQKKQAAEQRALEEDRRRVAELMRQQQVARPPPKDSVVVALPPPNVAAPPRDPTKPPTMRPFAKAKGELLVPVSGALIRQYNDPDELGLASKGLTYETREGAQIVAPYDGRVLFAGPFKGYGQILIIEHGDGYHSLLAGLDRIEAAVGQWLVAGEPVGVMPRGSASPRLYLELRHDGQPINPLPWLKPHDEKVSG